MVLLVLLPAAARCAALSLRLVVIADLFLSTAGRSGAASGALTEAVGVQSSSGREVDVGGVEVEEAVDDFTDRKFQVLVTGFEPFLDFQSNPSGEIAKQLGDSNCQDVTIEPGPWCYRRRLRICWRAHVLPVNRSGAMWTTDHLEKVLEQGRRGGKTDYDAVFHLGLEDVAKGLKLEIAASNTLAREQADSKHRRAVVPAPSLLATTTNVGWMSLETVAAAVLPAVAREERELWSRNPGTYYCNEVYFRTLQFVRSHRLEAAGTEGALLPVMFVHVPGHVGNIEDDTEVIKQIVGHALWGTYLAGRGRCFDGDAEGIVLAGVSAEEVARPAWHRHLGVAACFAVGAPLLVTAAFLGLRSRRPGSYPSAVREALLGRDLRRDSCERGKPDVSAAATC